ncbi:asparaginase [Pseudobutyrivibrio sp. MD2005]|uniref:asparaginase n=1 Tax=Pseudobutyrivibrio sp. MD2005 TaxID=1410616 RepID=UPI00048369A5|nr:asparaginase [Pseudobutyrivibrio sp. MD2005]
MSKTLLIINTGGTLSSVMKESGLAPGLSTHDMKKELHIVSGDINFEIEDFCALDSANIFPEDWSKLALHISELRNQYDGIVVIHGTDTLAYTSSMLSYMLQNINIPVVITGSQLSITNPVADAMENLRCAIHMAASGRAGVFVAFNRKVMLGCRASKVRSLSFDAFESINYPNVAEISSLGMKIDDSTIPVRNGVFHLENAFSSEVCMIKMFPGIHRSLIESIAAQGYKGLYIEAFGIGGMPFVKHDFISTIEKVVNDGMTVVVGTQCRYEGSKMDVYETGRRALESGVLQAHDMTSEAALTKLMWILGKTDNPAEIKDYFALNIAGEVSNNTF